MSSFIPSEIRTGRGTEPQNIMLDYIVNRVLAAVMVRSIENADFFVRCTNRKTITPKDILLGLMDSAWEYTDEMIVMDISNATAEDELESDESESDSDTSGDTVDSENTEDACEEETFSTQLKDDLSIDDRAMALRMKSRLYTWHTFACEDDMVRAALAKTINRMLENHRDVYL